MKTDKKVKYYQLRAEGKKQREAAELLGVSERTCRRWESEARSFSDTEVSNAMQLYAAQKTDQSKSTLAMFAMLESQLPNIDFSALPDKAKMELFLKFGRRIDELENKSKALPDEMQLEGLAGDMTDSNMTILEMQQKIYNLAAKGEITDEQARKKILLLTELRKSVTAADNW